MRGRGQHTVDNQAICLVCAPVGMLKLAGLRKYSSMPSGSSVHNMRLRMMSE